jgi:hypothetical protein
MIWSLFVELAALPLFVKTRFVWKVNVSFAAMERALKKFCDEACVTFSGLHTNVTVTADAVVLQRIICFTMVVVLCGTV